MMSSSVVRKQQQRICKMIESSRKPSSCFVGSRRKEVDNLDNQKDIRSGRRVCKRAVNRSKTADLQHSFDGVLTFCLVSWWLV